MGGTEEARARAHSLNDLGNDLSDEGRWTEAEGAYLRATEADPDWSVPWYNLGLAYKQQRRWRESAHANRRAVERSPADTDAWWNLGIAATALGNWRTAREAWHACGIAIADAEGPIEQDYGMVPVRINPGSTGEVVWSRRIDPARAVLLNVPLPASGFCEGDTVLHDGAPRGHRRLHGRDVPVFDVLERLVASPRRTFDAWIDAPAAQDVEDLVALAESRGLRVEDWTRTVRNICKACSEGTPHDHHDPPDAEWTTRRHMGVSAEAMAAVRALLDAWLGRGPGRAG